MLLRTFLKKHNINITGENLRESYDFYTIQENGKDKITTTKILFLRFNKSLPGDINDHKTYVVLSYKSAIAVLAKKIHIKDLELTYDNKFGYGLILPKTQFLTEQKCLNDAVKYPEISEYVDSIRHSEENFNQLRGLCAVTDEAGNPIMIKGNLGIVFKMLDKTNGKLYAIKCFLKDQNRREESYTKIMEELKFISSDFMTTVQYLNNELYVDTLKCDRKEFPIIKMNWIEGITLDRYVRENINNKYALDLLAFKFGIMASWIMNQEFAHGDLNTENIIVQKDGHIVLLDYDGMFVPSMSGEKSRELGSTDFQHPLRDENKFDASIDDFSLASIALSLKAIALQPQLLEEFGAPGRLIFSEEDYRNPETSKALQAVKSITTNQDLSRLFGTFFIAIADTNLAHVSSKIFNMQKPLLPPLLTEVTKEDINNAVEDKYGVKYSYDGSKLIKAPKYLKEYKIKEDTNIICHNAFYFCKLLKKIEIPNSILKIEMHAFGGCKSLKSIKIPNSTKSIGNGVFRECVSLQNITIPNSITSIGYNPFAASGIQSLTCYSNHFFIEEDTLYSHDKSIIIAHWGNNPMFNIPNTVTSIGQSAFEGCLSLQIVNIPNTVRNIGDHAFSNCKSLQSIRIPCSVREIGNFVFSGCKSLQIIKIPDSVEEMGYRVFMWCDLLKNITISNSLKSIKHNVFWKCFSLQSVEIPNSIISIEEEAFGHCKSLQKISIGNSIKSIGNRAFLGCQSLQEIYIPNSVVYIGNNAFRYCHSLRNINIPNSVIRIGERAFLGCQSLKSINIPNSVTTIEDYVFCECYSLISINIPNSVTSIGKNIFFRCDSLETINIPKGTTDKFIKLFEQSEIYNYIDKLNEI